jgi:hypothetical protein
MSAKSLARRALWNALQTRLRLSSEAPLATLCEVSAILYVGSESKYLKGVR